MDDYDDEEDDDPKDEKDVDTLDTLDRLDQEEAASPEVRRRPQQQLSRPTSLEAGVGGGNAKKATEAASAAVTSSSITSQIVDFICDDVMGVGVQLDILRRCMLVQVG